MVRIRFIDRLPIIVKRRFSSERPLFDIETSAGKLRSSIRLRPAPAKAAKKRPAGIPPGFLAPHQRGNSARSLQLPVIAEVPTVAARPAIAVVAIGSRPVGVT